MIKINIRFLIVKLLAVPILLLYSNSIFLLFSNIVFTQIQILIPILLFNLIISLDIIIRPISKRKDQFNRVIATVLFLIMPFGVALPYYEGSFLSTTFINDFNLFFNLLVVIGTIVLFVGGLILLINRIQLGIFGGSKIVIEENHQLITSGMYYYIRHPIYLGFLLIFAGYSTALGSLIITIITIFVLFFFFRKRMILEEKLLLVEFEEEYLAYIRQTKRLLPLLY